MKKHKVMFVDDNKHILNAIRRNFRDQTFEVLFVESAENAIEILHTTEISVVVADIITPHSGGVGLLQYVESHYPKTILIALTGVDDTEEKYHIVNQVNLFRYITRPWEMKSLKSIIYHALIAQEDRERVHS